MSRSLKKILSAKTALCLSAVLFGSVFMAAAQTPEQAESKPRNAANDENVYNKKPLVDFQQKLVDWRKDPQNDIYSPFQYTLEGTLGADGKLIVEKPPVFTGPAEIQQIVKTAVAALSDSGMFKFLQDLKSKIDKAYLCTGWQPISLPAGSVPGHGKRSEKHL